VEARSPCSDFRDFEKLSNGLLRRFAERVRSVDGMPAKLYAKAADWNSNLLRKILGYRTPAEMFEIMSTSR
jgi:IS30 family transposase